MMSPTMIMTPTMIQSMYQQNVTNQFRLVYIGLFLGVLVCLTARNVVIRLRSLYFKHYASSQQNASAKLLYIDGSLLSPSTTRTVEHFLSSRLTYAACFTPIELMLLLVVTSINVALVLVVSTRIHGVHSEFLNTPRAVSLRAASQAVAQMPIVFSLTGRNSIVGFLTGFTPQELRFSHKLFSYTFVFLALIHFLGITFSTLSWAGMKGLVELYNLPISRWGILAFLSLVILATFSLRFARKKQYELFLLTHIVGASTLILGIYYHNTYLRIWYYATIGIYALERLFRLLRLFTSKNRSRFLSIRKPFTSCTATLMHDAIVVRIPVAENSSWSAGQHCYLSFWQISTIQSIWFQNHPFSIMNLPSSSFSFDKEAGVVVGQVGQNEMIFVMKVHHGMTLVIANLLSKQESREMELSVSVEGPYGEETSNSNYEDVLFIAGGSGITHILSKLGSFIEECEKDQGTNKRLKLVWVFQYLDQSQWIVSVLTPLVDKVSQLSNCHLDVHYHVTRSSTAIDTVNMSTITHSLGQGDAIPEKKLEDGLKLTVDSELDGKSELTTLFTNLSQERPNISHLLGEFAEEKKGKSLVVACGPDTLTESIRSEISGLLYDHDITLEVASFGC